MVCNQTIKNGWSRNVLMHQIKSDLYKRQTSIEKTHNFDLTEPSPFFKQSLPFNLSTKSVSLFM